MKTEQKNAEKLLFGGLRSTVFPNITVGDRVLVPDEKACEARKNAGALSKWCTISRTHMALTLVKNFISDGDYVYGVFDNGTKFKSGISEVWIESSTALPSDAYIAAAIAAAGEAKHPEMAAIRKKVPAIEKDDVVLYEDTFYYSEIATKVNTITVHSECPEMVIPAVGITRTGAGKPVENAKILPWFAEDKKDIPNDLSVDSALKGKYHLGLTFGVVSDNGQEYDFSKDLIPVSFLEGYIDNSAFRSVLGTLVGAITSMFRVNETNEYGALKTTQTLLKNIMLAGDPGTGKTMLMQAVAAALGLPIAIFRLSALSEADSMTEEIKVSTNGFISEKARLYFYVKYGGIYVFDDMTNADPNTLFATIGGLLENPFQLQVGQTVVPRHPLCILSATMNVGTQGSRTVNEALLTRFPTPVIVEKMSQEAFQRTVITRAERATGVVLSDTSAKALAAWIYKVYSGVSAEIKKFDGDLANKLISIRSAIALAEKIINNLACGLEYSPSRAATEVFANILYGAGEPELKDSIEFAINSESTFGLESVKLEVK